VNACARVVGPDGLSLGAAPGFAAAHVQIVGRNDVVFVLEGPTRADGLWWWKVATRNNVQGWGNNDHMLPFTGDCFGLNAAGTPIPTIVSSGASGAGAVTPTLAAQSQLPDTGASSAPIIFAGALALIILFVGLIRRRTQGTI
jgi:LPXTG-motif cell wall-anchored protein